MSKANKEPSPDARARILEASTRLFAEKGLHGTTTREIASAADVNVSLISYYFDGKEALYTTLIRQFAIQIEQEVLANVKSVGDTITRESYSMAIETMLTNMVDAHLKHPDMKRLFSNEMNSGLEHMKEIFEESFGRILSNILEFYKRAQKAGVIRKDLDPLFFITLVSRSVDAYIMCSACNIHMTQETLRLPKDRDAIIYQLKTIFLQGVLTS